MLLPSWAVTWMAVLALGVIVGLLARFLLALLTVVLVLGVLGAALLGLFDPALLARALELVSRLGSDLPIAPAVFLTVGGLIFLVGVLTGVLLTSPLRGLARARPAA